MYLRNICSSNSPSPHTKNRIIVQPHQNCLFFIWGMIQTLHKIPNCCFVAGGIIFFFLVAEDRLSTSFTRCNLIPLKLSCYIGKGMLCVCCSASDASISVVRWDWTHVTLSDGCTCSSNRILSSGWTGTRLVAAWAQSEVWPSILPHTRPPDANKGQLKTPGRFSSPNLRRKRNQSQSRTADTSDSGTIREACTICCLDCGWVRSSSCCSLWRSSSWESGRA